MDEKGVIVCSADIDEGLALQIWTKGTTPRLVIVNKAKNTRKMSPFSWLEGENRKLSLKGAKGRTVDYPAEVLEESVRRMFCYFAQDTPFKGLLWHTITFMSDLFHTPRPVFEKSEMVLLPEEKRWCLWIADLAGGENSGYFRPFFPRSNAEQKIFGDTPGVPVKDGKSLIDLKNSGITRKLAAACPARWYETARVAATAALLGFSLFYEDGTEFSSSLWRSIESKVPSREALTLNLNPDDPVFNRFGRKIAGYIRHWHALKHIQYETALDSLELLKGKGFTRKRRFEFPVGGLGAVEYTVTVYADKEENVAVGCVPRQRTKRHEGDMVFTFSRDTYERAINEDSFGGSGDEFFTLSMLLSAKLYERWQARVNRFTGVFLSPGG